MDSRETTFSFPWWESRNPTAVGATFASRREAMYLHELEERAALLFRLRYGRDEIARRLRGNLRWDFELCAPPARLLARVEAIVDEVCKRGGSAKGARRAPPSLE
ncbi:MAG: hypothetical protein AABZ30_09790 [Myxococcota bacterium]